MGSDAKCPFTGGNTGTTNRDWWPNQLDLGVLQQNPAVADPMGPDFDYACLYG